MLLINQQALNELGFQNTDINGPVQEGTTITQETISRKAVRSSTANSYLDPNPFPKDLHILTHAFVTRVLFDKNRAIGVEFIKNGKTFNVKAKREVIVSAGKLSFYLIMN